MKKEKNRKIYSLWKNLESSIGSFKDEQTFELLDVIYTWVKTHSPELGSNFSKDRVALTLLLQGESRDFAICHPIDAAHRMRHILSAVQPDSISNMADLLEVIVREFAIFTTWKDCPVCEEGYLGYWLEPNKMKLVLCCPECLNRQTMDGEPWGEEVALRPLLKSDIEQFAEILG